MTASSRTEVQSYLLLKLGPDLLLSIVPHKVARDTFVSLSNPKLTKIYFRFIILYRHLKLNFDKRSHQGPKLNRKYCAEYNTISPAGSYISRNVLELDFFFVVVLTNLLLQYHVPRQFILPESVVKNRKFSTRLQRQTNARRHRHVLKYSDLSLKSDEPR